MPAVPCRRSERGPDPKPAYSRRRSPSNRPSSAPRQQGPGNTKSVISEPIKIHWAVDDGVKPASVGFAGSTPACRCTDKPVTVAIASQVAHNHACDCTKCWKPDGVWFSLVAVVSHGNVRVLENADKLVVAGPRRRDPAACLPDVRRSHAYQVLSRSLGSDIGAVARRQEKAEQSSPAVGDGVDPGGTAAARTADRLRLRPPFPPAAARCNLIDAGAGTKGPRLHEWCHMELADLQVDEFGHLDKRLWTRGLLIGRHIADGETAYFSAWCPAGTPMATLLAVEGHRRSIEDSFETAKNEPGLDHNETRSWHSWNRHVSLVMLAFAMMAAIRHRANAVMATPKKHRRPGCRSSRPYPPVAPGNPAHRHMPRPTPHPARTRHRMVAPATSPPGHRTTSPHQPQNATVMVAHGA